MSDPAVTPATPAPGPTSQMLAELASEMLANARHWETLNNPDRACQYHQAAALYASAANAAFSNNI